MAHVPRIVSIDTETAMFKGGLLAPPLVCLSTAFRLPTGEIRTELHHHSEEELPIALDAILSEPEIHIVGARMSYDMVVLCVRYPELWSVVWDAYEQGRIHDIQIMEKLRILSTTGNLEFYETPDGEAQPVLVSLTELEQKYLGVDRSAQKKSKKTAKRVAGEDGADEEASLRESYGELIDVPLDQWTEEQKQYPIDDAIGPLLIYEMMVEAAVSEGHGSMNTEAFQAGADFALSLITAWGIETDPERVEKLAQALDRELNPMVMRPLFDAELLRPAEPPRPHLKNPDKFTQGKDESVNKKSVQARVELVSAKHGIALEYTDGGASGKPQICTKDSVLALLEDHDPILKLYRHRQGLIKLKTTYLPVVRGGLVHFPFDILKKSGRTSSKTSKLFPSTNGQNPPRIGGDFSVRECYVPRPGHALISCDYPSQELCTFAQVTYSLLGHSQHKERINAGYDLHALLGGQLAAAMDPEFRDIVEGKGIRGDVERIYEMFRLCKKAQEPEVREFYVHWRTFAKPTGLGYPGGLGPEKFVDFARGNYDVNVTVEQASLMRDIWRGLYPEAQEYHRWVGSQLDPQNVPNYCYTSPMGMFRAGCLYTDAANGKAMQTPAAEMSKMAVFQVVRAMYDPSAKSCLYGCHLVNFLHDELLAELPIDEHMHERAFEICRLMEEAGKYITPDVRFKVEPAAMVRWYKGADPIYDGSGRLVFWEPRKKEVS